MYVFVRGLDRFVDVFQSADRGVPGASGGGWRVTALARQRSAVAR